MAEWLVRSALVSLLRLEERVRFSCSPDGCDVGINVKCTNPIECSVNQAVQGIGKPAAAPKIPGSNPG